MIADFASVGEARSPTSIAPIGLIEAAASIEPKTRAPKTWIDQSVFRNANPTRPSSKQISLWVYGAQRNMKN
jgi:hypothetical protein